MNIKTIEEKIKKIKEAGAIATQQLYYKGKIRTLGIFEVPAELLRFNYVNGRIGTEVKEFERLKGESLDQLPIEEVNETIHNWIWKKSENENKKTLSDIRDKRQIVPGVITRDGIVVDGNRRFMITRKLNQEGLNRQFLTVILEDTYEDGGDQELQIKKLETEIQLGQDEKVKYGAIEPYIKIMDFVDNYIDVESPRMDYLELSRLMGIKSVKEVEKKYRVGKVMMEYLEYIEFPDMFSRLGNTEDLFINLEKTYGLYKAQKGAAGWQFDENDIENYKTCGFEIIRWNYNASKNNKGDWESKKIRDIYFINSASKTIFSNPKIWKDFQSNIEDIEDIEVPSLKEVSQTESLSEADTAKKIDKIWADKTSAIFKRALGSSLSRIKDKQNDNQPEQFISGALDKLENLINEDLFNSTGEVEFHEQSLKILKNEDRIDNNYSNINKVRKIAETLKRLLNQ